MAPKALKTRIDYPNLAIWLIDNTYSGTTLPKKVADVDAELADLNSGEFHNGPKKKVESLKKSIGTYFTPDNLPEAFTPAGTWRSDAKARLERFVAQQEARESDDAWRYSPSGVLSIWKASGNADESIDDPDEDTMAQVAAGTTTDTTAHIDTGINTTIDTENNGNIGGGTNKNKSLSGENNSLGDMDTASSNFSMPRALPTPSGSKLKAQPTVALSEPALGDRHEARHFDAEAQKAVSEMTEIFCSTQAELRKEADMLRKLVEDLTQKHNDEVAELTAARHKGKGKEVGDMGIAPPQDPAAATGSTMVNAQPSITTGTFLKPARAPPTGSTTVNAQPPITTGTSSNPAPVIAPAPAPPSVPGFQSESDFIGEAAALADRLAAAIGPSLTTAMLRQFHAEAYRLDVLRPAAVQPQTRTPSLDNGTQDDGRAEPAFQISQEYLERAGADDRRRKALASLWAHVGIVRLVKETALSDGGPTS